MSTSVRSFLAEPQTIAAAREFVGGFFPTGTPCWDDARLLISELAGNAIRHAGGAVYRVEVECAAEGVRVTVRDSGCCEGVPKPRQAPEASEDGRGLEIVKCVSSHWGVEVMAGGGHAVWFQLEIATPATSRAG